MISKVSNLKFLFRADNTNVGDWWSPPFKYFAFKPGMIGDVLDVNFQIKEDDILIIGGGGIGRKSFSLSLQRIKEAKPQASILWGVGADCVIDTENILNNNEYDLYGNYFDFFDEVGVRIYSVPQKFRYVPCASCMSQLFLDYRERQPKHSIGIYNHKRITIMDKNNKDGFPVMDNHGNDLEEKIKFLSSHEYIVTNTYHGAYWATLLERKVICLPNKSGLFSFKHKPLYSWDGKLNSDIFNLAPSYANVLEECRNLNEEYYLYLINKYPLI